ncbi:MAG: hydrogenase expression protein HypE [Betaproteobacteria bacterium]|nr:MAG: hydrogenase expression protein HypE [Betaproteobacteria bacterium]
MSEATRVPMRLRDLISAGRQVEHHAPWPRAVVDRDGWRRATGLLSSGQCVLLGLWAERDQVHMALDDSGLLGVLSLVCDDKRFPSVGQSHAPAIRLERAIRDLWGFEPDGLADTRPWLDHGRWPSRDGAPEAQGAPRAYDFLPAEGESLHQIPVGPVHAGIIEPGHFRFTANGEAVVRLEARLGYAHKGIERLMEGAPLDRAAALAGRVSGDSTVAYALAFARAVEAALGVEVPRRALWLRALMAELERLANHFGDIGAICNDAAFAMMHAQCAHLREQVLRVSDRCFGHRLMMDRIVPGGVERDLQRDGQKQIHSLLVQIRRRFPELIELYDNTASLQDCTVGTGILSPELARHYGCGGYVGRASGRSFDARRAPGYPPYDLLKFEVPTLQDGDVDARIWIRIREVEQSVALIDQILEQLMAGPVAHPPGALSAAHSCEGVALVEGFRGDVLVWVRIGPDGSVERCHLRDPSWFQWPLLEAAIEGNIVADFPLCNKSFNCSYSGHDL